nr:immunoglobulin heavy chain junction region [Macaca mulatta]MOX63266.1 immunoglobulin heavy chain junction region [Macaca mulatta]MOX64992.1 immunoglobulin heavy chain junction region [Macaca mulatta]MOX65424.1 immunoglobulin heavy chain junction region [Macaca mulatta]MOX65648.1 immunoglobulin heavy chain junction region [Macaca mulatta]
CARGRIHLQFMDSW